MCDFVLFAVLFGVLLFVLMIVLLGVLCFVLMIVLFGVLLFVLMTHGSPARTAHLIPPKQARPRARSTAQSRSDPGLLDRKSQCPRSIHVRAHQGHVSLKAAENVTGLGFRVPVLLKVPETTRKPWAPGLL